MNRILSMRALRMASLALVACVAMTGCLSTKMYVDPALPVIDKADLAESGNAGPVQVLFEFRTKGNANPKATAEIRPRVIAVTSESGIFNSVTSSALQESGGQLKVVIDNIVLTDNAAAKGFGTGLTLGLAGSLVTDGYVCTAAYTRNGKTTETTAKHAIHTTVGNHKGPEGLVAMEPQAAIHQVMDQLVWNALKQLSDQGAFLLENES